MKFNLTFHITILSAAILCLWLSIYLLFYTSDVSITVLFFGAAALFIMPFGIIFCVLRIFIWRKCLEFIDKKLIIVTYLMKHVVPLDEIINYELDTYRNKNKLIFKMRHKDIPIYPDVLNGGLAECRNFLKDLGLKEIDNRGVRKMMNKNIR